MSEGGLEPSVENVDRVVQIASGAMSATAAIAELDARYRPTGKAPAQLMTPRTWSDYFYPGTAVLINHLGIRDQDELSAAEEFYVSVRMAEADRGEVDGVAFPATHDGAYLRAMHHWLAQDVYHWAGQYREVGISKGVSDFAPVSAIEDCLGRAGELVAETDWTDLSDDAEFGTQCAKVFGWLNYAHPFREVNGRATRAFMDSLAEKSGRFLYCGGRVQRTAWIQRCAMSMPDLDHREPYHEYLAPVFTAMARDHGDDGHNP